MTECPHCHAPLPEPPEPFCPNCGADLAAAGPPPGGYTPPPVPPAPPAAPPPLPGGYGGGSGRGGSAGGGPPWERREQLGFVTALIETTKRVLSAPAEFFRSMPTTGGIGAPLVYGLILGYVGLVASTIYNTVFQSVLGSSMAGMGSSRWERIAPFLEGGVGLVANLVFGPVFIAIGLFLSAAIVHLVLLALAGGGRGFEATFRAAAYSQAAAVFNVIPLCGGVVGAVYTIVLLIIGISEAHGISRGKAAAAVLLPLVVLCCCCAGTAGLLLGGLAGALSQAR